MKRLILLWLATFIVSISLMAYQRMTGPTYPARFDIEVGGEQVKGKLTRSGDINEDLELAVTVPSENVKADLVWQRYPIQDGWTRVPFIREDGQLKAYLPKQGMAGKIEFKVEFTNGGETVVVPAEETAIARFKGTVPTLILLVHVICMIIGTLVSNAAGFDAISGARQLKVLSRYAFGSLFVGGMMLGPVVQKYAFDAYWTGWPLGTDWTDNKLAVGALAWLIAMIVTWKSTPENKAGRWVVLLATLVTIVVYTIPHSIHGSTLDYETGEHIQVMMVNLKSLLT